MDFVLCPDKNSARFVRRELATHAGLLGVRVGTWPELLELAESSFCLPPRVDEWEEGLQREAPGLANAFWEASLGVDPEKTVEVLGRALREILVALGPGQELDEIPVGVSRRGVRQLCDLRSLWKDMDRVLPVDLATIRQLLAAPAERSVRDMRVHLAPVMHDLDAWQSALVEKLSDAADGSSRRLLPLCDVVGEMQGAASADPVCALARLQRELFASKPPTGIRDPSVQWLAVRDPLEEVELVAGMVRSALNDDASLQLSDIAVMIPDDELYSSMLDDVFSWAGLPLSGLSKTSTRRDLGREAVQQFLLCRRPEPTPVMALASLVSSPLMPWSPARGRRIAEAVMDRGIGEIGDFFGEEDRDDLLPWLIGTDIASGTLREALDSFCAQLRVDGAMAAHVEIAREAVSGLKEDLGPGEIDWTHAIESCRPESVGSTLRGPVTREGLAVFLENGEPWRKVRRLFVIGFSAGNYPRSSRDPSLFVEADRVVMNERIGTRFELAAEVLQRHRQRLLRQLLAASEAVTFTVPRRDLAGGPLAPSSTLSYMATLFEGVKDAEELILELDRAEERARGVGLPEPIGQVEGPRLLEVRDLSLGRDLLGAGVAGRVQARSHSPSRLEALLGSPLAWLLQHLHAEPGGWHGDRLDVLMRGTLAHEVFERLFAAGEDIPEDGVVEELVRRYLAEAIEGNAPHLAEPAWRIERLHLERELGEAGIAWRRVLDASRARVLSTEENLTGVFQGCELRGRADVLLQMPGGAFIVVDYKKSKSDKRQDRMEKGYDLQASLYRRMLAGRKIQNREIGEAVGVAYYAMNDQITITDRAFVPDRQVSGVRVIEGDVSHEALMLLRKRFVELHGGRVVLNRIGDEKRIPKETGIQAYALDRSPLIALFSHSEEES